MVQSRALATASDDPPDRPKHSVTSLTLCTILRNYRCQYLVFGILSRRRPLRAETRPFSALGQNSILNVKQMSNIF